MIFYHLKRTINYYLLFQNSTSSAPPPIPEPDYSMSESEDERESQSQSQNQISNRTKENTPDPTPNINSLHIVAETSANSNARYVVNVYIVICRVFL